MPGLVLGIHGVPLERQSLLNLGVFPHPARGTSGSRRSGATSRARQLDPIKVTQLDNSASKYDSDGNLDTPQFAAYIPPP